MKKLTTLLLAITFILSFTACTAKETYTKQTSTNRLEEILQRGYITIATEPYFAPNEFIDSTKQGDDKYVGSDIELAKYIAKELGVECRIVPLEFTAVLSSVTEGKYDLAISALAYSPSRAEAMNMSKGYYFDTDTEGYGVLVRIEDKEKYTTCNSMKDAVIAVQSGSVQEALVLEQISEYKAIKRVSSMTDAFLMVQQGKADIAPCFIGNGRLYAQANDDVGIASTFKFKESEEMAGTRIGIKKGEDQLTQKINQIIDDVVDSGMYSEWYQEYSEYAKDLGI